MDGATHATTPAATTRDRQRLDTHQRIYQAAEAEIRRGGLAGLSVVAVAKAAGVSRQTFYDHFPTLDSVIDEALARYRGRVVARLDAPGLAEAPIDDVLHHVVDGLFGAMDRRNGRLRQEISAYLARGVKVGGGLDEPLFRLVVGAIDRAQSAGELAPHHDPQDTARLVLTALSGFLRIESEPPDARAERAHDTVRLLLAGLRADPAHVSRGESRPTRRSRRRATPSEEVSPGG